MLQTRRAFSMEVRFPNSRLICWYRSIIGTLIIIKILIFPFPTYLSLKITPKRNESPGFFLKRFHKFGWYYLCDRLWFAL